MSVLSRKNEKGAQGKGGKLHGLERRRIRLAPGHWRTGRQVDFLLYGKRDDSPKGRRKSMEGSFRGQIVLNADGRIPSGWHACNGALLRIPEYTGLFTALGTKYGGGGMATFGLPKLSGLGRTTYYIIATKGSLPRE
jgi:hypothetical protein